MAELHPQNDEAAEIVGAWKRGEKCSVVDVRCRHLASRGLRAKKTSTSESGPSTTYPVPDMRTPAMVVKMIEWLQGRISWLKWCELWESIGLGADLKDTVLLAVISTKESTDAQ